MKPGGSRARGERINITGSLSFGMMPAKRVDVSGDHYAGAPLKNWRLASAGVPRDGGRPGLPARRDTLCGSHYEAANDVLSSTESWGNVKALEV